MVTFIGLIILFNLFPYYKLISSGSLKDNSMYVFIIMWVPGISAFITKGVYDKTLKGLGFKIGNLKYILTSYLIPVIAGLMVYSLVWIVGLGKTDFSKLKLNNPISILFILFLGVLLSCITALGEEIGWRGFLVPELSKKYSYTKTSIITAIVWSIYHYPPLMFSDYNNGVSILSSFAFFTIGVFAICFIASWLRLKSGSLWTGVILHASHNYFIQGVFDEITIDTGHTKLFTTEFGIGLALIYSIMAFYFWRKRGELKDTI